jgi:hypothetical protein
LRVLSFLDATSPDYDEFLEFLGEKITLQGWANYRGGLDVKSKIITLPWLIYMYR